ncbi:MAG: hypothetical protein ACFUZC_10190 [Chthoniobacteraceae bacterium]
MSNIVSDLILRTGAFNAGIKNAEKGLQSLKGGVMGMKGVLMGAFAAITTGAAAMKLREQFDMGRQLNALSSATGTSVKDLVVLQKAFGMSGVEADRVAPMIGRMRKGIADAAAGGAGRDAFAKLHLSLKALGQMNASDQMKAIGDAVMQIQNPTQRTAASMAIFGRQGQDMLKVFASGAMADAADDMGAKAKILDQNSALFADISKKLEKISAKTGAMWAAMAASIGPAIKPILDSLANLDFSKIGQQIGDAVAFFIAAFSSGEIGNIIGGTLVLAFQEACNFLLGNLLGVFYAVGQYFAETIPNVITLFEIVTTADFWKGMGSALMGIAQGFIAFLLDGVAMLLEKLKNIPGVGKKADAAAAGVREQAAKIRAVGQENRGKGADQLAPAVEKVRDRMTEIASNIGDAFQKGKSLAPKLDTDSTNNALDDSFGKVFQMVKDNQDAADKFNAEHSPEQNGPVAEMDAEPKRKLGPAFVQSLYKIGGGGTSVGGGKDPLLEENRRQTGLLSQIARNTALKTGGLKTATLNASFA